MKSYAIGVMRDGEQLRNDLDNRKWKKERNVDAERDAASVMRGMKKDTENVKADAAIHVKKDAVKDAVKDAEKDAAESTTNPSMNGHSLVVEQCKEARCSNAQRNDAVLRILENL